MRYLSMAAGAALLFVISTFAAQARPYEPQGEKFWERSDELPTFRRGQRTRDFANVNRRRSAERGARRNGRSAVYRRDRDYVRQVSRSPRYASRSADWEPSEASRRYESVAERRSSASSRRSYRRGSSEVSSYSASESRGSYSAGPRPGRWCGWWMRTQRGGGPELNLARNWARWGRPSGPQVGAVVVWRGHVGQIVGKADNGQWLVQSGNDGGRVRTRARSVAGAVFRMG